MFSKVFASLSVLLAISVQVNAHAAIAPALGVDGTPVRADVQRPSTASPCGTVNVASTLDTSTPVQAAADGTFTATATDFNAGADGSRSVTAKVDPTAQGKTFSTAVTVSQNGDAVPTTVGSDQIVAALPAGTTCSGGTAGNLCLVAAAAQAKVNKVGTRAPRALLAEIESRGEEALHVVKRGVLSWVWA
ncbi:hypothetical protein HHX47_DHR10000347 [Lentinula edodes]|nr:hypothetical protein HHX47_DHR10000347 [Lentinula edodes]